MKNFKVISLKNQGVFSKGELIKIVKEDELFYSFYPHTDKGYDDMFNYIHIIEIK